MMRFTEPLVKEFDAIDGTELLIRQKLGGLGYEF